MSEHVAEMRLVLNVLTITLCCKSLPPKITKGYTFYKLYVRYSFLSTIRDGVPIFLPIEIMDL